MPKARRERSVSDPASDPAGATSCTERPAPARYLVVDALADVADGRGVVFGVPVSLILARPASKLGDDLVLNLMDDAGDKRCQVEVDLTEGRSSVKLLPPGRHLPIPVQAASGLPSPF